MGVAKTEYNDVGRDDVFVNTPVVDTELTDHSRKQSALPVEITTRETANDSEKNQKVQQELLRLKLNTAADDLINRETVSTNEAFRAEAEALIVRWPPDEVQTLETIYPIGYK